MKQGPVIRSVDVNYDADFYLDTKGGPDDILHIYGFVLGIVHYEPGLRSHVYEDRVSAYSFPEAYKIVGELVDQMVGDDGEKGGSIIALWQTSHQDIRPEDITLDEGLFSPLPDVSFSAILSDQPLLHALERSDLDTVGKYYAQIWKHKEKYPYSNWFYVGNGIGYVRTARIIRALSENRLLTDNIVELYSSPRSYEERKVLEHILEALKSKSIE